MARVLLTGGAGFIGSQIAHELIDEGLSVVVLDKLTYAGRREHLAGLNCDLVVGDVCDPIAVRAAMHDCQFVIHAAAESHVVRSLDGPDAFFRTNIEGTRVVLESAQDLGVERVIHLSTDEVFGEVVNNEACGVDAPMRPGNPYAASKVGAEAVVHAWRHTYDLQTVIVRCTNNYGPRQHIEKAVPCWTAAALDGGPLPIDGEGTAFRDWLYVEDFSRGILALMRQFEPGSTWHFAGRQQRSNRQVAEAIAAIAGIPAVFRHRAERVGQDRCYCLDDSTTRAQLGWSPKIDLEEGLRRTVAWYRGERGR